MKLWIQVAIGLMIVWLTPIFGLYQPILFVPIWIWFTWWTARRGRVDSVWLGLAFAAEMVSPDLKGVAFLVWTFFWLLVFWWRKFFPSTEMLLSQVIYGIVSASIWFIVNFFKILIINNLASLWPTLVWQWLWHASIWILIVCLSRLTKRYVFS